MSMSNSSKKPSVLIVDDEPIVRSWIRTAVSNLGCKVLGEASDGTQALLRHAKLRPDITFLDIDMPGKSGIQVLADILTNNPDAFVVIVSAHSTMDNVKLAIESGASGFVVKPFNVDKFNSIIEKYMNETATV